MKPSFLDRLERRARAVSGSGSSRTDDASVLSTLEDELSLTLEHLDRIRGEHERVQHLLTESECDIGTDLLQLAARQGRYGEDRFEDREHLKGKLLRIQEERRRLDAAHAQRVEVLQTRLLTLVGRHELLRY